ncbi:DUF934 domain-containing protein [Xanthobacter autotrophicus]|uniref:DUF934 domain-containing protein n=1 Tax=Xanthobacter TaxID=279 RepID=UPI0024AB0031|nr:DUF934 domain-containing protein [Xanthobacter autotrophicus]MDI4663913.1 DUF934 domain-containing protein [Xanthobacter autotrophicus]
MPLVKNGALAADPFVALDDDAALPDGPVIVSAARLLAEGPALVARNGEIGVAWPNDKDVAELQPFLSRLSLITLTFPKFRDGRAYSQARLLRERYGYKGELRAVGNVLRDQVLLMVRAGFDAFALEKAADAEVFGKAVATYSVFYQPTGDRRPTVRDARTAQAATGV